jgi:hypothetical protein
MTNRCDLLGHIHVVKELRQLPLFTAHLTEHRRPRGSTYNELDCCLNYGSFQDFLTIWSAIDYDR